MISSTLSMVEAKLPPGFRFHPRDEELICFYLMNKISSPSSSTNYKTTSSSPILTEVDLNKCEPWDIPATACVGHNEWYFYTRRDRKYTTGMRTNRATLSGYWKATGKDKTILQQGILVGMRKTLVFYQGRAPTGGKTSWVMHEFRLLEDPLLDLPSSTTSIKEDWVLCRVFKKSKKDESRSQSMMSSCIHIDDDKSSSSLPPLLDYNAHIIFEQIQANIISNDQYYNDEQVSSLPNHMDPNISSSYNNNDDDDENVIRAVLNQYLTTMEGNSSLKGSHSSLGEEGIVGYESYSFDVYNLHTMWSHC